MLAQRHAEPTTLWRPCVGWLLIASLYLIAAVLGAFLAIAVAAWWPLLLATASALAAVVCTRIGFDRIPVRPELNIPRQTRFPEALDLPARSREVHHVAGDRA